MRREEKTERIDVYQKVTDRIMAQLEAGCVPWHRPWHGMIDGAVSYSTGKPYSLLNQMLLGRAGEWLTFNQIKEQGGSIKKGAKASFVCFYKTHLVAPKEGEETKVDSDGNPIPKKIPVLRSYNVFHIEDCEGVKPKLKPEEPKVLIPIEEAERVIATYTDREKLKFINDKPSNRAYYSPTEDKVVVPMLEQYDIVEEYYSTAFHELTHSTSSKTRCDRPQVLSFFGNENYSREELVAEIGSAMLCDRCGIDSEKAFKNSAAYIASWLNALRSDNKMIVWAASKAEKAARFILGEIVEPVNEEQ